MKPRGNTVAVLTHFGRKSGKRYQLKVWWVDIDDQVWLGSMDSGRAWVRNLRATGRAEFDRGDGAVEIDCEWVDDPTEIARFRAAITRKHPIVSRLLRLLFERDTCAFRTIERRAAP